MNRLVALIVAVVGSLLPLWVASLAVRSARSWGHWDGAHIVMLAVPLLVEALVLGSAIALVLGKRGHAKRLGVAAALCIVAGGFLLLEASGEFASRMH